MRKRLYFLSSLIGCSLLFYAIPRFSLVNPEVSASYIFSISWFAFAFLVIGSQLYRLLGMDNETAERLEKIKQIKRKRQEEMWQRMLRSSNR